MLPFVGLVNGARPAERIANQGKKTHPIVSNCTGVTSPADLGISYAAIGEKDRALAWLEKAYAQHDPPLAQIKVDPSADSLRSDPRYLALLARVGLAN